MIDKDKIRISAEMFGIRDPEGLASRFAELKIELLKLQQAYSDAMVKLKKQQDVIEAYRDKVNLTVADYMEERAIDKRVDDAEKALVQLEKEDDC